MEKSKPNASDDEHRKEPGVRRCQSGTDVSDAIQDNGENKQSDTADACGQVSGRKSTEYSYRIHACAKQASLCQAHPKLVREKRQKQEQACVENTIQYMQAGEGTEGGKCSHAG